MDRYVTIIVVTWLLLSFLFIHWIGWNEYSRYFLTISIYEENSFKIDKFANYTGDKSFINNHYFSDKQPLMSFVFLPWYMLIDKIVDGKEDFSNDQITINDFGNIKMPVELHQSTLIKMVLFIIITSTIPSLLSMIVLYKLLKKLSFTELSITITIFCIYFGSAMFYASTVAFPQPLSFLIILIATCMILPNKRNTIIQGKLLSSFILLGLAILNDGLSIVVLVSLAMSLILHFTKNEKNFSKTNLIKFVSFLLVSSLIGMIPFLTYNYVTTGCPFILTRSYYNYNGLLPTNTDKAVSLFNWSPKKLPENSLFNFIYNKLSRSIIILAVLTFYPYRNAFLFWPIYLFGFYGLLRYFKKDNIIRTYAILIIVLSFISNSFLTNWWGGTFFGNRYLFYIVLPVAIGIASMTDNIINSNKKTTKIIFIPFIIISLINNITGQIPPEYPKIVINKGEVDVQIIKFPIINYYYKNAFNNGIVSKTLQIFLDGKLDDIRTFKPMIYSQILLDIENGRYIILNTKKLILFITMTIEISILAVIVGMLFNLKIERMKKTLSLVYIFLSFLVFLIITKYAIIRSKIYYNPEQWYPLYRDSIHWMKCCQASIRRVQRNDGDLLILVSYNRSRIVEITMNNITKNCIVTNPSSICYLKYFGNNHDNTILLKVDGCDYPALSGFNDYRCLSVGVAEIEPIDNGSGKNKFILADNWYPAEKYIVWAWKNPTIILLSNKTNELKCVNITSTAYKRINFAKLSINGDFYDTVRFDPWYDSNIIIIFKSNRSIDVLEFGNLTCITDENNPDRCISIGIKNVQPCILQANNHTLIYNWYKKEKDGIWSSDNSTILLTIENPSNITIGLKLISYRITRNLTVQIDNRLYGPYSIQNKVTYINITGIYLSKGIHTIKLISDKPCEIPSLVENSSDNRCLTFKLLDMKIYG